MALMGSDQAKLEQDEQARAVLDWLGTQGAQALLQQVAADRAQRADQPDIQRGQEEVQRRRDQAVHDWLNTPEAQRFLMGREDADIAMRQQAQRGPGTGAGPQPQPALAPRSGGHWRPHPQRDRMVENVLANQGGGFAFMESAPPVPMLSPSARRPSPDQLSGMRYQRAAENQFAPQRGRYDAPQVPQQGPRYFMGR